MVGLLCRLRLGSVPKLAFYSLGIILHVKRLFVKKNNLARQRAVRRAVRRASFARTRSGFRALASIFAPVDKCPRLCARTRLLLTELDLKSVWPEGSGAVPDVPWRSYAWHAFSFVFSMVCVDVPSVLPIAVNSCIHAQSSRARGDGTRHGALEMAHFCGLQRSIHRSAIEHSER